MTPLGYRLKHALDLEHERMLNEWFFKWHFIGKDGPVEIDRFDGNHIRYGNVGYFGTTREVYWDTLNRYARIKVNEIFLEAEDVAKTYPLVDATALVEDTAQLLSAFIRGICDDALEKDRILRGDGFEHPDVDRSRARHLAVWGEIHNRRKALQGHLEALNRFDNEHRRRLEPGNGREILSLRPGIWGVTINLKEFCRWLVTFSGKREGGARRLGSKQER